jgi:lysine 2,3-aminomutase
VEEMKKLMKKLMKNRIKPYYLHHPDPVKELLIPLPVSRGLEIMAALRGHISGMCIPYYMIDLQAEEVKPLFF